MLAIRTKRVSGFLKKYKTMERREFFRKGGRLLLLSGMAAGSAYLVINGQVEKSGFCKVASHCKGCSKLTGCVEEQAAGYRQAENHIKK
jgi:hypothetical protein